MAYIFQFRADIEKNWENVILADREIGILQEEIGGKIKNTNLYKIGDGITAWKNLPYFGFNGTLSNTLEVSDGEKVDNEAVSKSTLVAKFNSLDEAIEQLTKGKATTDELLAVSTRVTNLESWKTEIDGKDYDNRITTLETLSTTYATDIQTLKDMHVVMSQDDFIPEAADPNTFYYIYEETKE